MGEGETSWISLWSKGGLEPKLPLHGERMSVSSTKLSPLGLKREVLRVLICA